MYWKDLEFTLLVFTSFLRVSLTVLTSNMTVFVTHYGLDGEEEANPLIFARRKIHFLIQINQKV